MEFVYMDNGRFAEYAAELFEILADNMSVIAPTGNSRETDFTMWSAAVGEGMLRPQRRIVLVKDGSLLAGYFQYYVNDGLFMMEEIQFRDAYKGRNSLFRRLYAFVLPQIPEDVRFVEAYASKQNAKSQGILARLGLRRVDENKSGNSWKYRGKMEDLRAWMQINPLLG